MQPQHLAIHFAWRGFTIEMRTSNLISRGFLPFFICSTISLKYQDCVCCRKKSLQFLSTMSYGLKMVSPVTWYWHHLSIWFTHQILELVRPLPLKTSEISNHGISSSFLFFSFLFFSFQHMGWNVMRKISWCALICPMIRRFRDITFRRKAKSRLWQYCFPLMYY